MCAVTLFSKLCYTICSWVSNSNRSLEMNSGIWIITHIHHVLTEDPHSESNLSANRPCFCENVKMKRKTKRQIRSKAWLKGSSQSSSPVLLYLILGGGQTVHVFSSSQLLLVANVDCLRVPARGRETLSQTSSDCEEILWNKILPKWLRAAGRRGWHGARTFCLFSCYYTSTETRVTVR